MIIRNLSNLFTITLLMVISTAVCSAQETVIKYLSGTDKDHTMEWDFFCTKNRKSGAWTKIQVPSNWEQQGFGAYNYGHDKVKADEQGLYKHRFKADANWKGKKVFIVFEGSMTDTEVKINGKLAGDVHQGAFYRFKYNITDLLNTGADNLLEVTVSKMSANKSVNQAERSGDFWIFGGIYRPVYLEIVPETFIDRMAIDAKANGFLQLDVFAENLEKDHIIKAEVQTLDGKKIGKSFTMKSSAGSGKTTLKQQFNNVKAWNPEFPDLYDLVVSVSGPGGVVHRAKKRFGFRTMELRKEDGIYVNGKKIIYKGVNRHSSWPETGRTLSKEISLMDVELMKEMNMNAVRMSHYPPDQHFLDVCDSLGLFVLDELTGWQAKYDTLVGRKLVKELVERDVNHPSVLMWVNGNEGGFNRALDGDYKLYDPQNRPVIHPWEKFNGTDTKHYPDYNYVVNSVLYGRDVFFPTEFMHGLYDGGHGAGLDDFWNLMLTHPFFGGGFLWSFHDEGMIRTDKNGVMDTDGNHAPDGIVGPHREKEASFYAIKEIWSPVVIGNKNITESWNGNLEIENRYLFTNLEQCTFSWKLVSFSPPGVKALNKANYSGNAKPPVLAPGEKGILKLNLPANWNESDALNLTAVDPNGKEIFTWSWPVMPPDKFIPKKTANGGKVIANNEGVFLNIKVGNIAYAFDREKGYLMEVKRDGQAISLTNGPVLAGVSLSLSDFKHYQQDDAYVVQAGYKGEKGWMNVKWIFRTDNPAKLEYSYGQKGDADFMGITFNYPEEKITGMEWLGQGPYRVWKNRLKGSQFGVWHKDYNNTVTGEGWQYPEFKGYHANMYWVRIENKELPFTIYTDRAGLFLQMLKPTKPAGASNDNTSPAFPDGDIGFLNAISPIGTKFQAANLMGPQSQKNIQLNYSPIEGNLWFDFR